jgi:hypothetical protein
MSKEEGVPSTAPAIVPAEREAHIGSLAAGAMLNVAQRKRGRARGRQEDVKGFGERRRGKENEATACISSQVCKNSG